ncbi:hypothetical protein L211DRAFT_850364 [Terfezia boudieri ATCC MYA-4762]|uniref:Uncharacterized protein n=1 Tax=Terfezia boudieri ATCC MYA-4762 TaxID=1051890 RepID=A0A3N4LJ73_9PEZI|nr:hypothetical protein L211DRAFT_850364 [Terfezia boudieri ATCC MYA-4762]
MTVTKTTGRYIARHDEGSSQKQRYAKISKDYLDKHAWQPVARGITLGMQGYGRNPSLIIFKMASTSSNKISSNELTSDTPAPATNSHRRRTLKQRHAALRASNTFWNPNPDPLADDRAPKFGQFQFLDWEMEQEFYSPVFYKGEGGGSNQVSLVDITEVEREPRNLLWHILVSVAIILFYAWLFIFIGFMVDLERWHHNNTQDDGEGEDPDDGDDEHDDGDDE